LRHREPGSGASPALLLPEEEYPEGGRWWEYAQRAEEELFEEPFCITSIYILSIPPKPFINPIFTHRFKKAGYFPIPENKKTK